MGRLFSYTRSDVVHVGLTGKLPEHVNNMLSAGVTKYHPRKNVRNLLQTRREGNRYHLYYDYSSVLSPSFHSLSSVF